MNVNKIISLLREEPARWYEDKYSFYYFNDNDYVLIWRSLRFYKVGKSFRCNISFIDRLCLRYAIWKWKLNKNKFFEWMIDGDGLPYLQKINRENIDDSLEREGKPNA